MTMTREEATAAGWTFAFYGEEVALCRAMKHPLAVEAETPGQVLKAVTAIERYPQALATIDRLKRPWFPIGD